MCAGSRYEPRIVRTLKSVSRDKNIVECDIVRTPARVGAGGRGMPTTRVRRSHATRGAVSRRLLRLLDVLFVASSGRAWKLDELARRGGVSRRTVFKDLQLLNASGFRIASDRRGYRMLGGRVSMPVTLRPEEVLALLRPGSRDGALWKTAEAKLATVLPQPLQRLFLAGRGVRGSPAVTPTHAAVAGTVEGALAESRTLRFEYMGLKATGRREWQVEPHGLFMRGSAWYLVAWAAAREDYRLFRLDRVHDISVGSSFEPRVDFDLDQYLTEGWGGGKGGAIGARVEVLPSHVAALESEAGARGLVLRRESGRRVLEIPRGHVDELAWWLAQFGEGVRVLEPEPLRQRLRALAERILELNK